MPEEKLAQGAAPAAVRPGRPVVRAGWGAGASRHQATSPGTRATAQRSSDHSAASPRRSHQAATSAATM
ncbi:hypothetical protein N7U49_38570 [Streptomyces sp. AD2-2]|nr:hypothetical protein N7U49_38570 [Streptomyces sp. AD2-2]